MNLQDITTKPWILALFKRDDGERFLLGDGYFDFKDSLQHFQPNTMANDIVELQGSDGQLLAGQVRRGASQSFDGYIGDGTTTRAIVEERRREFLMFFRKKHFYSVVYIFCDGSAIKRERGYLVDAPSVPEIRQLAPSYHVALNFEDVNYYEYKEDINGNEIYSNIRNVVVSTIMTGGLIWDNLGAVSEAIQWAGKQTATGSYITINDGLANAPMSLTEIDGDTTQNGTPTPSAPVAINTVTGENTLTVTRKNLFNFNSGTLTANTQTQNNTSETHDANSIIITATGTVGAQLWTWTSMVLDANATYTVSGKGKKVVDGSSGNRYVQMRWRGSNDGGATWTAYEDIYKNNSPTIGEEYQFSKSITGYSLYQFSFYNNGSTPVTVGEQTSYYDIQLELGNLATTFEPYQGQSQEINLGKNLFDTDQAVTRFENFGGTPMNDWGTYQDGIVTIVKSNGAHGTCAFAGSKPTLVEGETYTLSATVRLSGTNATNRIRIGTVPNSPYMDVSGKDVWLNVTKTFTATASDVADSRIDIQAYNTGNIVEIKDIQLELGSTATTYAPYFTPIELCKIGTYQDKIYLDSGKWYIEKQVGKVVLDGTENWQTPGTYYCSLAKTEAKLTGLSIPSGTPLMMSNNFTCGVNDYGQDKIGRFGAGNSYLNFNYDNTNNTTTFKTWLTSNNTVVYAPLATPTTTEITDATLLAQLNAILPLFGGVNNISLVPSGAQGSIAIEYYTSIDPGGGYEWEDGGTGGATIINIEGVDAALPIWEITGLATNPTLTNITTGQTITWTGTVPSGQTLIIDMNKQTATMEGANVFAQISGDWLELAPGINRITYSVLGTDQPSTLSWNNIVG